MFGNGQESYQRESFRICGNDLEKAQRIHYFFRSLIENNDCCNDSVATNPVFANDKCFQMTPDELKNAPPVPECTKTWCLWKHHHNNDDYDLDNDFDFDDDFFSFIRFKP